MSNMKKDRRQISFGEYRVLASLVANQYEVSDTAEKLIPRLVDRGLIVPIPDTLKGYNLTEAGQQVYDEHEKEWKRVRAEMSVSLSSLSSLATTSINNQVAESLKTVNWLGESTSVLMGLNQSVLQDTALATSMAAFTDQLRLYDATAHMDSFTSALKELHPSQSAVDAITALKLPLENVLSTVGHFSVASTALSQLKQEAFASSALLSAASKDIAQSIVNSASLRESVLQITPWAGYISELNVFSGTIVNWIKGLEPLSLTATREAENLAVISQTTHLASIPPAYSFAESEEARSSLIEDSNSITYNDPEIADKMVQIGTKYQEFWGGIAFAMNQKNPGRVKQVVYSARELIQSYIDEFAPSASVQLQLGKESVSRRERIKFLLRPDVREETIWVVDHLDSLVASLDATMSAIGHSKNDEHRDALNLRALVGLVANAIILLENNRRK